MSNQQVHQSINSRCCCSDNTLTRGSKKRLIPSDAEAILMGARRLTDLLGMNSWRALDVLQIEQPLGKGEKRKNRAHYAIREMATSLKTTIQEIIGFIPGSMIKIPSAPTALAEQAKGMDSHAKEMLFQHANHDGEGMRQCWQAQSPEAGLPTPTTEQTWRGS